MKIPLWSRALGVTIGFLLGAGVTYAAVQYSYEVEVPASVVVAKATVITGVACKVNCESLTGVTITLYDNGEVEGTANSDGSGNYTLTASISELGEYEVVASKDGFKDETQSINITELGQEYEFNFRAETGLIPNAADVFYVLECVNQWLFPESPCALSVFKVLEVVNAWLYPV